MKNFVVLLIVTFFAAATARAQVTVDVLFDGEQFLANEPLVARIRIVNESGTTLHLGAEPDWLSFNIETLEGPFVQALRPPTIAGAFDLESSHTATKRVDLAPAFNLSKPGRYKIVATVRVASFNTRFASPGREFYITTGTAMKTIPFGCPANIAPPDKDGVPEMRKFILTQVTSPKESKIYVRLTDRFESNIRIIPIGQLISFSHPEPQLDKWSNLHLLYQTSARDFSYISINPMGLIIARETHMYTDSRPILAVNDEGHIYVRGGARRLALDDIPPVDAAQLPDLNAETTPAPSTNAASKKASSKKSASSNGKDKQK